MMPEVTTLQQDVFYSWYGSKQANCDIIWNEKCIRNRKRLVISSNSKISSTI